MRGKRIDRKLPPELQEKAREVLSILNAVTSLHQLGQFRGLRLEELKGSRKGEYSIRINDQYRVCFKWDGEGHNAYDVSVEDYH